MISLPDNLFHVLHCKAYWRRISQRGHVFCLRAETKRTRVLPESEKAGRVCVCSSGDDAWELLLRDSQEIRRGGKTSISSGKEGQDSRNYQFECRYLSSTQMVFLVIFGILPQENAKNWWKMPKLSVETPI